MAGGRKRSRLLKGFMIGLLAWSAMAQLQAKWGATPMKDSLRPPRGWMDRFSATPDVVAEGSIARAIDQCDDRVGSDGYCVVEIGVNATGLPLEIERSRLKLTMKKGRDALTTRRNAPFIYIGDGIRDVVIEGLDLQGHRAGDNEIYGIVVEGKKIRNIAIMNNRIHDFDSDENAHAIAVYGTAKAAKAAVTNVIIEGNEIRDMRTGSSESIAINGNVRRWEIIGNVLINLNNIAIDAIGGEGTSPARTDKNGRVLPGRYDAARYGFIENNRIEKMHTLGNPAYDNEESWAAAVYVDGGHHILIRNNQVVDSAWGYEIGAENCIVTRQVTMTGNSAEEGYYGDLVLGGYAHRGFRRHRKILCDPTRSSDDNEGHGYVKYLTIKENTFQSEATKEDPITLQYRITHAIIIEPGVDPVNDDGDGSARGDENAIRTIER